MKTFKIYWKNGTTDILIGRDIADAFNSAGYGKEHIESMEKYLPVIYPSVESLELAVFSCSRCKGYPDTIRLEGNRFGIYCPDCDQNKYSKFSFGNEEDARLSWNKKQLSMIQGILLDIN